MNAKKPSLPGGTAGPLVAGIFTVIAAIIGIMPNFVNRPNASISAAAVTLTSPVLPTQAATVLAAVTPTILPSQTAPVLATPTALLAATNTVVAASPTPVNGFSDNFLAAQIDPAKWDAPWVMDKNSNAHIVNGRLEFIVPADAKKGSDLLLKARYPWTTISQIGFAFKLETALSQKSGSFIVITACAGGGRIEFSVGAPAGQIVANYYADARAKSPKVYQLGSLVDNNEHTVLMKQVGSTLDYSLDNAPLVDPAWPEVTCKWAVSKEQPVSFGVSLDPGTQMKGTFDNISITP
jgi:hypothetical protein